MDTLEKLYNKGVSRRNFLAGAGALSAASVLAGCSGSGTTAATTSSTTYTDADILNFALNLEYLEAEFYLRAATGSGLTSADTTGTGTAGAVTTNASVTAVPSLTSAQAAIIAEIAYDEQQHVRFLRKVLGSVAVARPAIDLTFFSTLATAAGISGGSTFSPFSSWNNFLIGAFIFEDVGVTAYHGAAPLIVGSALASYSTTLLAAAGIMAVEAYHAAYIRTAITAAAIGGATSLVTIANQVATLRATLGGGNETMLTVPTYTAATTSSTNSTIVAADTTNAIAFSRSTDQVHHIVYGSLSNTAGATAPAAGVSKGGFFPAGTNSIFSVTAS